ncbi:MAG: Fic family protein [Polaribacter sp.]|jgi:Fic family protein
MAETVLKNDKTGEIVYIPPQKKDDILDLLGNFLEYFNVKQNDLNPLINLAILHYQFESIHPFYDANGRVGRILNIL